MLTLCLVHIEVCLKTHSILARLVFVLHGHRLCCDIAVVLIASIAIRIPKSGLCTICLP